MSRLSRWVGAARGGDSSWDEMRVTADAAYDEQRWAEAAVLWDELFEEARTPQQRVFAGRRAALSYRRSNQLDDARRMMKVLVEDFPDDAATRRELARLHSSFEDASNQKTYWDRRSRFMYIQAVKELARRIGSNARSVIDVGSHGTPILEWFPTAQRRVSLDIRAPYNADGIESHEVDFIEWKPDQVFDLGLCLQVLEHIRDVEPFARRLLEVCDVSIVSVPYQWPESASRYHFHDPVDEASLRDWFGREPNYQYRIAELDGMERLVAVYDRSDESRWPTVTADRFLYRWSLDGASEMLADGSGPPIDGGPSGNGGP